MGVRVPSKTVKKIEIEKEIINPACKYFFMLCLQNFEFSRETNLLTATFMPLDGSFDSLILENPKKFIKLAKNAKTIKIEAPFFNEGSYVFTFDIKKPLVW